MIERRHLTFLLALAALLGGPVRSNGATPPSEAEPVREPIKQDYETYVPDFVQMIRESRALRSYGVPEKVMRLSSEKGFYTLNLIPESARANALVEAAILREHQGQYRKAIEMYQRVIAKYPDSLFRVSKYGVFVPVVRYSQLRMLGFPPPDLEFYRIKYDSRAREAYETARRKNSLDGLADIRDRLLCTSYGLRSILSLGHSALDQGYYLQALDYFEAAWDHFPEVRTGNPRVVMAMALCRKMLGQGSGDLRGPVGHWKMDEAGGTVVHDSGPYGVRGSVWNSIEKPPSFWAPGKSGQAFRCAAGAHGTASVRIRASRFQNIGTGDSDFSVALWFKGNPRMFTNELFAKGKRGRGRLFIEMTRSRRIQFTIDTEHPTLETGTTKGGIPKDRWGHMALIKAGREIKVFISGKIERRQTLKGATVLNANPIFIGRGFNGLIDDVRLYKRALMDREVAGLAGTLGQAKMTATPSGGEAPLAVEFACPAMTPGARCLWEFGDGQTAAGPKARHTYRQGGDRTAVLTVTDKDGRVAVARREIAVKWAAKDEAFARKMERVVMAAKPDASLGIAQLASSPHISADDYTPFPPTADAMGLKAPVWERDLPASRKDVVVYTQPVVTARSVIYRHKNILYSRSILNGEIQWTNDIGGRVNWQNRHERQYPHDALLVQDGLVFTPMHKVGPSLVALDEVTGQLKWAYGPAVASTKEESKMRFEAALAGGPRTVFAGYVLDNIEGETHTDTEYGVIAFESTTGRAKWRRPLSWLPPGKFAAGFAVRRRNRIRSFSSPPLYYQGTVYYGTNAGAIAALDALSGQVKWLARYPYHPAVHDATRGFGGLPAWSGTVFTAGMHEPSFWFNQRPLVVGDRLFVLPIDSRMMHCLDRRTGKVLWSRVKTGYNYTHLLGPTRDGYLVLTTSGRGGIVHLIDPKDGKTAWTSPDPITPEDHPVMTHHHNLGGAVPGGFNRRNFFLVARPFLMSDDRVVTTYFIDCGFQLSPWCASLAEISLKDRKVLNRRRYYVPAYQQFIAKCIRDAKGRLKALEDLPHKDSETKKHIQAAREISKDTVPQNRHGPFLPFARVTADRYGTQFELRITPRSIGMLYDRGVVNRNLAKRTDAGGLFAKAELAVSDARLEEAADLMKRSLAVASSEDLDFRAVVNQQLHVVYKRLAQRGVRRGHKPTELAGCIGMSRTVNTLEEEIESLLALSEAYERQGDWRRAARLTQSLVNFYGQREYPIPSVFARQADRLMESAGAVLDRTEAFVDGSTYARALGRSAMLSRMMLGLYSSALSPLKADLRVRAGELGTARLIRLQKTFPGLRQAMEEQAEQGLVKWGLEEQLLRLWEYPGTAAAQRVVDGRLADIEAQLKRKDLPREAKAKWRKRRWMLADAARVGGLTLPDAFRRKLLAPESEAPPAAVRGPMTNRNVRFDEERSPLWLVLQRSGQRDRMPHRIFLGGRVKKRLDYKFLLYCVQLSTGQVLWKARENRGDQWMDEIRLGAKGDEPGFSKAFVFEDIVVVHGMYEVLAFGLNDGKLRWRYLAPHTFEIRHARMSGDLLVLAGNSETVALYLGTDDPRGEVVWQEKEEGEPYCPPYFHGDRLVEVRKMPANLTVRYRSTGKLIGRLALPDLMRHDEHPLVKRGPRALAIAHDREKLAVTDGWYYIMVNVEKMKIVWKRLIDANDVTRLPPMRFELDGDYLAVVKQDYDVNAIHMLSSVTGTVLWRTDPKNPGSPYPIHSMFMRDGKLYGIKPYPGQGFYLAGIDCKTGKDLFRPIVQDGYGGKPECTLRPELYGNALVVAIKDRQNFELKAFDAGSGKRLHTVKVKAAGRFGDPGSASATVQNGSLALLGKRDLILATPRPK